MAGHIASRAAGIRDSLTASDPGLGRLRTASSTGVAMAGALILEYLYARLSGADPQSLMVSMIIGTVVAMMGSNALTGPAVWPNIRTAAFFPVAIGTGLFLGITVSDRPGLMLVGFVVVMFAAVFVRRFGLPFFFYGFMGWMGYFFASFLHPPMSQLPALLIAVVISSAWVVLLATTVLRTRSGTTLRHVRRSFGARARAVSRAAAALLAAGDPERRARLRQRLHLRQLRLAEAALLIEGWSAEPGALPEGWSATALRRRLLESQLAIESLAQAAEALSAEGSLAPGPERRAAHRVADLLSRRHYAEAERAAHELLDAFPAARRDAHTPGHGGAKGSTLPAARQLAAAASEYTALARRAGQPPLLAPSEREFEPAVSLALGNLPGSASVAKEVSARGRRWNPLTRVALSTRQAFQAALAGGIAILVGKEISEQRYYWAVIAAFIAFTGTATRSETFIKASHRVTGTLLGLIAGIGLAHLTAGHTMVALGVIVLSMSCGTYLVKISYAFMIFFVTIMVAQMYTLLHEFSAALLLLRLEETAAGAVVGIVVSLVFLPTSTRDTVNNARGELFSALAELLDGVARRLVPATGTAAGEAGASPEAEDDPDALSRAVDHRLRGMVLVAGPLTRPLVWGNDPRSVRQRLTLYAAAARRGRVLAALARHPEEHGVTPGPVPLAHDGLAEACRALAASCRDLAAHPDRSVVPTEEVTRQLAAAEAALDRALRDAGGPAGSARDLLPATQLTGLLAELATAPSLKRGGPVAPAPVRGPLRKHAASGQATPAASPARISTTIGSPAAMDVPTAMDFPATVDVPATGSVSRITPPHGKRPSGATASHRRGRRAGGFPNGVRGGRPGRGAETPACAPGHDPEQPVKPRTPQG